MDRGIPTEEILEELRQQTDVPVRYLVGTPKGRLSRYEADLVERPWREVRPQVRVKLLEQQGETYVLAESRDRTSKERAMRRRRLKAYWKRLKELKERGLDRDALLVKLGGAREKAGRVASVVRVKVGGNGELEFRLDRKRLRTIRNREGRYLLRTNLGGEEPEAIWKAYMQLSQVEEAFRTLKGDLGLRPIFHSKAERIEAHLFLAFLAYCLSVTLRQQLRAVAGGLMPRVVLEKLGGVQMLDVRLPVADGRELLLIRRTEPETDVKMLLEHLGWSLPPQPPPRIRTPKDTCV
jgi:predicted DNA-binding ribbon-helix-helix protein